MSDTVSTEHGESGDDPQHVMHDIGYVLQRDEHGWSGDLPVVPALCDPGTGCLRTAVLAAWADNLVGMCAVDAVEPRIPVTVHLDVHLAAPVRAERVLATSRIVKAGNTTVVGLVEFTDDLGMRLGHATGIFVVNPDPTMLMPDRPDLEDRVALRGGPLRRPLAEHLGFVERAPGSVEVQRTEHGLNSSGTVNGAVLAVAVEEAVLSARPGGGVLSMLAIRYLRSVRVGPAVATATLVGDLAHITVIDEYRGAAAIDATARLFPARS